MTNLTHNHKINQEVHDASSLSQEEESLVTTLRSANAQTSQIKRVLKVSEQLYLAESPEHDG